MKDNFNKTLDLCNMTSDLTHKFNVICQNNRHKYTDMLDKLSELYGEYEYWWFTSLVSRNIELSRCYKNLCLLILAIEEIRNNKYSAVNVPENDIALALKSNLSTNDKIKICVTNNIKRKIKPRVAKYCGNIAIKKLKKRIDVIQSVIGKSEIKSSECILVDTFIISSEFKNDVFRDRYFTGLEDNTNENIVFLATLQFFTPDEGISLAKKASELNNTIIYESFVCDDDYNELKKYSNWCKKFKIKECNYEGLKIESLINGEINEGTMDTNPMIGILKANVLKRLISDESLQVKKLISWYEGQAMSAAFFYNFRRNFPHIPTVGYAISPFNENNMGLYPSDMQYKYRTVPEYMTIQGSAWIDNMTQFCKNIKLITAPSFRYNSIFSLNIEDNSADREGYLLVLPFDTKVCNEMLTAFFEAVDANDKNSIYIKSHPLRSNFRLEDYNIHANKISNIKYVNGLMTEVAKNKKLVLLSETTSVLEVVLCGSPTAMYVAKGRLANKCIPNNSKFEIEITYCSSDIKGILSKCDDLILCPSELITIREESFVPVNNIAVDRFLKMEV